MRMGDINHGDGVWSVTYPSGKTFTATGTLVVGKLPGCGGATHPVVFEEGIEGAGRVFVLDPRAVVRHANGEIVYLGPDEIPPLPEKPV